MNGRRAFALSGLLAAALLGACGLIAEEDQQVRRESAVQGEDAQARKVSSILADTDDFSLFARAVKLSGSEELLAVRQAKTIFVPADSAFDKLSTEAREALFAEANRQRLTDLVRAHIVKGRLTSVGLGEAMDKGEGVVTLTALDGSELTAQRASGFLTLTRGERQASIAVTDLFTDNGVVFGLDSLLVPWACAGQEEGAIACDTGS